MVFPVHPSFLVQTSADELAYHEATTTFIRRSTVSSNANKLSFSFNVGVQLTPPIFLGTVIKQMRVFRPVVRAYA